MKNTTIATIVTALLCATASAHERITIGPNGGRLIALDSPATPNAEFGVVGENFVITLLDSALKPMPAKEHALTATAGKRGDPRKLEVATTDGAFVAGPKPPGEDYWVIFQLKETPTAKPMTFRVHYQTQKCGECGNPEWLCICGAKKSGENIAVPATLQGLFAKINQHHAELEAAFPKNEYEVLDEVTDAFEVLLKVLPARSGDKAGEVQPRVDALLADLAAISRANAARTLSTAAKNIETFRATLAEVKKSYPGEIANAKQ